MPRGGGGAAVASQSTARTLGPGRQPGCQEGCPARRHGSPEGCLLQHPRHTPCLRARCELRRNELFEKSLPAAEPNLSCQSGARLPALVFSAIDLLDRRNIKNLKLLVLITTSWRLHHSTCLAMLQGGLAPSLALSSYRASVRGSALLCLLPVLSLLS